MHHLNNFCLSGQGGDASRSYFQDQRPDLKLALQNQSRNPRSQAHKEDKDVAYEANNLSQNFEGLEQKFLDDIIKLVKEQNDSEDAENARHREVSKKFYLHLLLQFYVNIISLSLGL